jgi:hypothetical protein
MDTRISVVKAPLGYSCVSLPAVMQVLFISCAVGVKREANFLGTSFLLLEGKVLT